MFGIQPIHIVVIIIVALLIFGPNRLPEMGRNIGKALNEFRRSTRDIGDVFRDGPQSPADPQSPNRAVETRTSSSIPVVPVRSVPFQNNSIAPAQSGNFCIQCGASNTAEAIFCNHCGTKLPEKVIQTPAPSSQGD